MTFKEGIVIQGHVPDFDVQGSLYAPQKQKMMGLALRHLRQNNPHAYIVLSGHGHRPEHMDVCDAVYWEDKCRPLDGNGYVANMPGQFWFIGKGLDMAFDGGCHSAVKTRLDCLIGISNINQHCEAILEKEKKELLLTQQTGWNRRCGDCFLYGFIGKLNDIFGKEYPMVQQDGLLCTGERAEFALNAHHTWLTDSDDSLPWPQLLRRYVAFRDTINLKFADLRWNWHELVQKHGDGIDDYILGGQFDYFTYAWGRQWHRFDDQGRMIYRYLDDLISEKEFYETPTP